MAGEIVGSASIRIEPDTTDLESGLLDGLKSALEQATALIQSTFQTASAAAAADLGQIGTDGLASTVAAADVAGVGVTDAFVTAGAVAADNLVKDITTAGADAASAVTDELSTIGNGTGDIVIPITADSTEADAAIADTVATADSETAAITIDGDVTTADAAIADTITVADAETATVTVDADTSAADQAISDLGSTAESAGGSIGDITGQLSNFQGAGEGAGAVAVGIGDAIGSISPATAGAVAGVVGLVGGFKSFVEAGVQSEAATIRLDKVTGAFKSQVENVNVGTLSTSLKGLSETLGSSLPKMEGAAANIFQLGTASHVAGPQVAETTNQIVALAANAVALKPQLGDVGDATDGLGRALARGGRFAAQYGISLTTAQISAEAFKDRQAGVTGALSQYEKEAAGAKLATDQLGPSFQKNIADAANNPIIQLNKLKNDFVLLVEKLGLPLVSPAIKLLTDLQPIAEGVAKAVGGVFQAITPLFEVIGLIAKPIGFLANAIGELNPALLGLAAAATIAYLALIPGFLGFTPFIGLALAAATAISSLIGVFQSSGGPSAAVTAGIEKMSTAFTDQSGVIQVTSANINKYISATGQFDGGKFATELGKLGVTASTVTDDLGKGKAGVEAFSHSVDVALGTAGESAKNFGDHLHDALLGSSETDKISGHLIQTFKDLQQELDGTAAKSLVAANASGFITDAQLKAALATDNITAALGALQPQIDANAESAANFATNYGPVNDAIDKGASALTSMQAASATATDAFITLTQQGTHPTGQALLSYAVAVQGAGLSTKDFALFAGQAGVSVAEFKAFVDGATKALDSFVSTAVGKLSTTADAFTPVTKSAGGASSALGGVATNAASAQKAIETAQQGIVTSNHGVETANRAVVDSADALVKANEGVQLSVDKVADAQRNLINAEAALELARKPATPKDLEQANIGLERSQLQNARAADAITAAEDALNVARSTGDPAKIKTAEQNLTDARLNARESVIRISDAEAALAKVRQTGTEQDAKVVTAEKAVATAQDAIVTANTGVITSHHAVIVAQRGVEDSAYNLVQAQHAVITANEALHTALNPPASGGGGGGKGGGGGAFKEESVSLDEFLTNLTSGTAKTKQFFEDLDLIVAHGGALVAGELALQGPKTAAGVTKGLVDAIKSGHDEVVKGANATVKAADDELLLAELHLRTILGPAYLDANGKLAALATKAFGDGLKIDDVTKIENALALKTIDIDTAHIAAEWAKGGKDATDEYAKENKIDDVTYQKDLAAAKVLIGDQGGLGPAATVTGALANTAFGKAFNLYDTTTTGIAGGVKAINDGKGPTGTAGQETGAHGGDKYASGLGDAAQAGIPAGIKAAVQALDATAIFAAAGAETSGKTVGHSFATGIAKGINESQITVNLASSAAVTGADKSARVTARSNSPSELFADLGRDLMAGAELGIIRKGNDVVHAAEDITRQAAVAFNDAAKQSKFDITSLIPTPGAISDLGGALLTKVAPAAGSASVNVQVNVGGVTVNGQSDIEKIVQETTAVTRARLTAVLAAELRSRQS